MQVPISYLFNTNNRTSITTKSFTADSPDKKRIRELEQNIIVIFGAEEDEPGALRRVKRLEEE
jgi:hypothetical protein